ncbi:membrane protein [Streptococcus pneumoniae]|nr:membrane protein [Streptococcus pneumoniae]
MKKETFTEKLIKRTYGISGPLDEYKRREADSIGNQVFIVLFYLMIFGNLIPLLLAYKYPQEVALIYPPLILVIALIAAGYVTYQMKKTGITAIDPDMLSEKESKQLHYPGLKAGLIYGMGMFFGIPLLNVLTDDSKDYLGSLLNAGHFVSTILATFFFGVTIQIIVSLRIRKVKKDQEDD